jgi:DNA-binding MurR/RpiR family transcriptional regulator
MYEERDERGDRKWSISRLAATLGVGETTAWRAINSLGSYVGLPEAKTDSQISCDAAASAAKLMAMLGRPTSVEEPKEEPAALKMMRQAAALRKLEKEAQEKSAREKMAEAIEKATPKGDKLLNELTGESNDRRDEGTAGSTEA